MLISKNDLPVLLDRILGEYEVYAPVKEHGKVEFKKISSGTQVCLQYSNSQKPPKGILFPQSEKMFCYETVQDGVRVDEICDCSKKVIWGIRPCDAKSFTILDDAFKNEQYRDPYYYKRRENTVIVGFGCNRPGATCFCTSVNSGPFDTAGSDVFLTELEDKYYVEGITEKGKEFIARYQLPDGSPDTSRIKESAVVASKVNLDGLKEKLDVNFYDEIWDSLWEKCIGCAACTYLCPTCHCFDIVEEAEGGKGCRVRNWDACMFPLFTLHGSGHNPRPSGKERVRQRIMHKFKYFQDKFQQTACVGCGRCIKNCPVNLDIRILLDAIQQRESGEGC
ncbi:4Fe-4S dicluster domain-containing protein [Pelotomaculum propionicicum]|uniref:Anaerobic sulfite reductase subunit A n=1 Tax=Pelotomaculum propionicicum TaxID=258475 RepID=A0A4Y7RJA0_9FIRM|nr:4Fe-4S dicluster domain-containing protein [Pelotomaculum propionicicum]TEB08799.1 Anaerobic sulfite reductase subunit A [Pelotomaculum propionicicum]